MQVGKPSITDHGVQVVTTSRSGKKDIEGKLIINRYHEIVAKEILPETGYVCKLVDVQQKIFLGGVKKTQYSWEFVK